jgi:threonine/homoserine/homoserine lactone efflux protein
MVGRIIGIIISLGLIIAGLSGEFVLKGTNSSTALVVVGFLWLAYDVFRLVRDKKKDKEENNE